MKQVSIEKQISRTGRCQAVVCVILAAMMSVSVFLSGCRGDGSAVVIDAETSKTETAQASDGAEPDAEPGSFGGGDSGGADGSADLGQEITREPATMTEPVMLYVHVCGEVCDPGVYALREGSRVWDAVEAAGGFAEEAAQDAVNLAAPVADGSKVTIPSVKEVEQSRTEENRESESLSNWYEAPVSGGSTGDKVSVADDGTAGLVDINRADVTQLMTVPGIGQVRAEAIIAYRKDNGAFRTIEDIMQVTGIKEGLFEKIRDYITVGG